MKEPRILNKHSEEVQEIITQIPSWITRWGVTIFASIFLTIISIAGIIHYPSTIKTEIKFESADAPLPVFTTIAGKINKVFVSPGSVVKMGQPLINIQSLNNPFDSLTISASRSGKIAMIGIVQTGLLIKNNAQLFNIHSMSEKPYGLIRISKSSIGRVKLNQIVLIHLNNYSSDKTPLKGKVSYISDDPDETGFFIGKVELNKLVMPNQLKEWMTGNAEIITQDLTVLQRVVENLFASLNKTNN